MSTFSLVINHTPWRPERVQALLEMHRELRLDESPARLWINNRDYRDQPWQQAKVQWAIEQWEWSVDQHTTHHVFMTDDLHIAPHFWDILHAMVAAADGCPIGLLSNHPKAWETSEKGHAWYATNSWLVGPAYVLPHKFLIDFLAWFKQLPDGPHTQVGTKAYRNDDSSINEFVTNHGGGGRTLHPLPTIVEHRADLESTVGHGDKYSRERVSWRFRRWVEDDGERFFWCEEPMPWPIESLRRSSHWAYVDNIPMLPVGGE